jgi:hypothetical protein
LGYVQIRKRNFTAAQTFLEESLAIRRQTGNQHGIANCLDSLGAVHIYQMELSIAKTALTESRNIYEALGNRQAVEIPLSMLGSIAYIEGNQAKADALYEQAYLYARESGNKVRMFANQILLALTKLRLGHHDKALTLIREVLHYFDETSPREITIISLTIFSLIALATEHTSCGVKVAAKVAQLHDQGRTHVLFSTVFHQLQAALVEIRTQGDSDNFAKIWAEGVAMSLGEARKAALDL